MAPRKRPATARKPGRKVPLLAAPRSFRQQRLETGLLITFTGTSGAQSPSKRSVLPCALYKASLAKPQLRQLRESWKKYLRSKLWKVLEPVQSNPNYQQKEAFFKLCADAPNLRSNGGDYRDLAPEQCRSWWKGLASLNRRFFDNLRRSCQHLRYETNHGQREAFVMPSFDENLFSLATLQQREWPSYGDQKRAKTPFSSTYSPGAWHADGGPSSIFMAITLAGERILEIENAEQEKLQLHLRPGDFYVSQPSSFWHNVSCAKVGGTAKSLTLILRSTVLQRRISGGRQRENGSRTPGITYKTKACMEKLSSAVSECIVDMAKNGGFNLV